MSITFSSDRPAEIVGWAVGCFTYGPQCQYRGPVHTSAASACAQHQQLHADNDQCDALVGPDGVMAGPVRSTDADPHVNLSNQNAARILDMLGLVEFNDLEELEPQMSGVCSAQDFLGRVLIAKVLVPADEGMPQAVCVSPSGAVLVECERPAGYTQHRLEQLHELALFAQKNQANITWG
jgi:hypothetical protein